MPEWAPHDSTWLTWPHNAETWPDCLDDARAAFVEMIRVIGQRERVDLIVQNAELLESARRHLEDSGVETAPVRFHEIATNDSWVRDYGPLFVHRGKQLVATDWRFNAWGQKYPPWSEDDAAGSTIASLSGAKVEPHPVVLEGGSIDIDEFGNLLTTRQNVFAENRGPRRGDQFARTVKDPLGTARVIMLGDGIVGDDTDGHVDDVARFAPGQAIVTAVEQDRGDDNFEPLAANLAILERIQRESGHHIVHLPMPEPIHHNGHRLPASYANFYIANAAVLMPSFGQARDSEARSILQSLFTDRPVVPIDARTLVIGLGACHCLTMQQPTSQLDDSTRIEF